MMSTSMSKAALALLAIACSAAVLPARAQEGAIVQDFSEKDFMAEPDTRALFEPEDFVFEFDEPEVETPGGNLRPNIIATNPFLGTLPGNGNGQNLVTLEACGVNQPHVHPRGIETSFITKGELLFGLVEENGGRVVTTNLTQGTAISIAQGLMHFAQNLGCEPAQFLANFPHRDPGTQTSISNFFRLPRSVVRGTLGLDDALIDDIMAVVELQDNPSIDAECAKRCGLNGGGTPPGSSPAPSPSPEPSPAPATPDGTGSEDGEESD